MTDTEPEEIDFTQQLEDHSHLFLIAGVFTAVAAYLYRSLSSNPTPDQRIPILAFLSIAGLLLVLFYTQLKNEVGSWSQLVNAHISNLDLAMFSTILAIAILGLVPLAPGAESGILMFSFILAFCIVPYIFLRVFRHLANYFPKSAPARLIFGIGSGTTLLYASRAIQEYLLSEYSIIPITDLNIADPSQIMSQIAILVVMTTQSFATVLILATLVAIPLILFDKYRGKSPYDSDQS